MILQITLKNGKYFLNFPPLISIVKTGETSIFIIRSTASSRATDFLLHDRNVFYKN